ncbi:hypothetical protein D2E26_0451 [Bifidobacterium dolichotidis]|uniref:HipA-like C-terminal domain-containing protein n=1 Tax=Bifidobacterium dolichotidis TaxID=2306976 RepID=A0A430FSP3_9BIFI|nr:hypothetical protein [Bifidobacterium dolichotidis]RSX55888.1 hypothetical protein D2E26_0451 [Bifidobacterium dolichotidis]
MAWLVDFESVPQSDRFYYGTVGRKVGIQWHTNYWALQYPALASHKGTKPDQHYTTAPLSEFLSSHLYRQLGIAVQDTVLGLRDGRVVCACKDVATTGEHLIEFKKLRNTLSDTLEVFVERPSYGSGVVLTDVIAALHHIPQFMDMPEVRHRFWDMFVIDAFTHNTKRNNMNWGLLAHSNGTFSLAPVYGNACSFSYQQSLDAIDQIANDDQAIKQEALDVKSVYTTDAGAPIQALQYITGTDNTDCIAALDRFIERYDSDTFQQVMQSIPTTSLGVPVITDAYRRFQTAVLEYRLNRVLVPAWKQHHSADLIDTY